MNEALVVNVKDTETFKSGFLKIISYAKGDFGLYIVCPYGLSDGVIDFINEKRLSQNAVLGMKRVVLAKSVKECRRLIKNEKNRAYITQNGQRVKSFKALFKEKSGSGFAQKLKKTVLTFSSKKRLCALALISALFILTAFLIGGDKKAAFLTLVIIACVIFSFALVLAIYKAANMLKNKRR